jgi:hypothetical protein
MMHLSRNLSSKLSKVIIPQITVISSFSTEITSEWKPKRKGRKTKRNYERMHQRKGLIKKFEMQNIEHEKKAKELNFGWRTCASIIVERPAAITEDVPEWEQDFIDLQERLEYYEMHDWPEGLGPEHPDKIDHDHEDKKLPFELAPRETLADVSGDMSTMERALQESLYLMFSSTDNSWEFPQTVLQDNEFLGNAAIRCINDSALNMPRLFHFKRQPIGYMYQPFNDEQKNEFNLYGTKTFFYSAIVIDCYESIFEGENIEAQKPYKGISWRKKNEVCDVVQPELEEYFQYLLN